MHDTDMHKIFPALTLTIIFIKPCYNANFAVSFLNEMQNLFFPRKTVKHKIFTCETLFIEQDISNKKR